MRGAMFMYSERDMFMLNVDDIIYIRALDEADLDPRTGELRSGIPRESVTELRLRDAGTHYLREPLEDFFERLRSAMDVLEVPR